MPHRDKSYAFLANVQLLHPVSGAPIVFVLDLMRPCSSCLSYRDYELGAGPFENFYVAAIYRERRCVEVVGPAANAATALLLARQRVDARHTEEQLYRA